MVSLKTLAANEDAQGLAEYALLAGLIALVVIGAVTLLGKSAESIINNIATQLNK
jgi:pilus assembly protein Flp/PilA